MMSLPGATVPPFASFRGDRAVTLLRRLGLLRAAKSLRNAVSASPLYRRLITSNFRSGLVALGERNSYTFPSRWVTLDWEGADFPLVLTEDTTLPFAAGSQRIVYSAHVLEHLDQPTLDQVLSEAHRILRPGGGFRIEVPDTEFLLRALREDDRAVLDHFRDGRRSTLGLVGNDAKYLEDHITVLGEVANYIDHDVAFAHIPVYATRDIFDRELAKGIEPFNDWAQSLKSEAQKKSGGHSNALYYSKLERLLHKAGFTTVRRVGLGQTIIPGLRLGGGARSLVDRIYEREGRALWSLYVDALK